MGEPPTIPEAGHENPESGQELDVAKLSQTGQPDDGQRVMSVEMALAQALQHLAEKPEG
jgi:hypothetical protein